MFLFSTIGLIQPLAAAAPVNANDDGLSQMNAVLASLRTKDAVTDVLAQDEVIPRGPTDVLNDYENQMTAVSEWLTGQLGAILQAVDRGELTREQGEYFIGERYETATMQFQLMRARYAILAHEIAATPVAPKDAMPAQRPGDGFGAAIFVSSTRPFIGSIPGIEYATGFGDSGPDVKRTKQDRAGHSAVSNNAPGIARHNAESPV
jgi:hypothetical protein